MSEEVKVYEFAKQIGMETIALMDKIKAWKLPVKSHMAGLSAELIAEIKMRLEEESPGKKKKKKTTRKTKAKKTTKKTKKKTASKKVVKKVVKKSATKIIKKSASASGSVTDEEAEASAIKKAKKTVIRRKASTATTTASPESGIHSESRAIGGQSVLKETVDTSQASLSTKPGSSSEKTNIVGRVDLSKIKSPVKGSHGEAFTKSSTPSFSQPPSHQEVRPPRSSASARNLRTGFVAAPVFDIEHEVEEKKKEEKPRKKGGPKEQVKEFKASDFRKREVIFQPKKKKINLGREAKKTQITVPKASKRIVKMYDTIKVSDLAQQLGVKANELIKKLMVNGVMANINSSLDYDTATLIASEYNFETQLIKRSVEDLIKAATFGNLEAEKKTRPPVVTVMGHVDHGKTTLLDAIRHANVAKKEAGGITQHIGAYKVQLPDKSYITFIDTPGHEAFTAMRERGAHVTDIVILVVAADDGVMPQTIEALNHAKAANVPIVVALNKIDRPNANPDKIKQQLAEHELVPEDWGGDTIYCEVSALQGKGIDNLLEQVRLVAEIQELKANPERSAQGVIIESRLEKGLGPVATLLVQEGYLEQGQPIVSGEVSGRVRVMKDDQGKKVKKAYPGDPVEVVGFEEPPEAGDAFYVCKTEEQAREIAELVKEQKEQEQQKPQKVSLEELFSKIKSGDVQELPVVLKADVSGSLEAVKVLFNKVSTDEVKIRVVHAGVGAISKSDILLASTAKGLVIGFNVRADSMAQSLAKEKGVEIKTYTVVYQLMDDIKKALSGLLKPEFVEKELGKAEVREVFSVPKVGNVAGCFVTEGKIQRGSKVRLVRDGKVVYEGQLGSLRRFKDDVKEVAQGYECGIGIENYNDIKPGDVIESFIMEEVQREL